MAIVGNAHATLRATDSDPRVTAARSAVGPHVCMIAYTFYSFDARVRREAETLASHGFHVRRLTPQNSGPKASPFEALPSHLRTMQVGVVGNRRSAAAELMLPVKLLEYVSLRVPAVVPRLTTVQHYFGDDMVSYYEPEDVESLAAAIDRLYCEPELRCRQSERAQAFLAEHGWDRQGPELVALYRNMMEQRTQ